MGGLGVRCRHWPAPTEFVYLCLRAGGQQRRMGGNDQLCPLLCKLMDAGKQRHLPDWGQGGLGFIKDVQPTAGKTFARERQEAFAVRLFVQ